MSRISYRGSGALSGRLGRLCLRPALTPGFVQGRCTWVNLAAKPDEDDDDEDEEREEEPDEPAPEVGPPLLTPLSEDEGQSSSP